MDKSVMCLKNATVEIIVLLMLALNKEKYYVEPN